jgi:serine/threonine-protein kinase
MTNWRIGEFTELRELGAGAQGRVVLARHDRSGTPVAIKYVRTAADRDRELARHEALMLARVNDPHVARLYQVVESDGAVAIVMEAVDGVSLRKILDDHGTLGPEASLTVLKGSLLGLSAAHAVGVVHRDYKPANVMVQGDGLSKLIDFGIAGQSGESARSGTPSYMAPEQWRAEPATPATDVYAATCVFFECVTGHRPYRADDQVALMGRHVTAPVPVEDVPEPLRDLVARGMAKRGEWRPPGASAFVAELEAVATAAYGSDWERRGVRSLAVAAAALAALFPLAALGIAPVVPGAGSAAAQGAIQAAGQGSAKVAAAGKGVLATTASKTMAGIAGTVVVATAVTAGIVVYQGSREPERPLAVELVAVNEKATDLPLEIRNAQYVRVTGLRDAAIERKVNQVLRAPFDQGIVEMRGFTQRTCTKPTLVTTKARTGLRGPVLVSVAYGDWGQFCVIANGTVPRAVVTVDLRTGKALTADDIYRPTTLTAAGLTTLYARLSGLKLEKESFEICHPQLKREDFFPRPAEAGAEESPPAVKTLLKPDGLEWVWSIGGSDCSDFRFTAPYAKVRDLLKPELVALLPG